MGIVNEDVVDGDAVLANLHHFQSEALLHESVLVVLAEDERLAMTNVDGVACPSLLFIYGVVGTVVEDYAVLKYLAHGGSVVLMGSL